MHIETVLDLHTILRERNLVPFLEPEEVRALGFDVAETFKQDKDSRREWEVRMRKAMDLALQVSDKKTFPWEDAANVKIPLVTVGALQYQSRVYPALVDGADIVAAKPIVAGDKSSEQAAMRIGKHMSYQLLEEMLDWEEEQDKAFIIQAIMGCVFKKTWYDPVRSINRSICVNPRDLVINYWATSVEAAPRVTHLMYLSPNDVREMQLVEVYSEFDPGTEVWRAAPSVQGIEERDKRIGLNPPPVDRDTPYEILEQCRYIDLDGDGYREPYLVAVRHDTRQVLRICALFTRKDIVWARDKATILRITPCGLYTKYPFIPSPDGGVYDLGFGSLLGTLSHVVDSAVNQMLDAGTMANAGGGFLGKNAKMKKGDLHISPGKWITLDCPGSQMKDAVMPLPVPQPSTALFQLVQFLVDWGQHIIGATDALMGLNPGQNTPAQTQQSMVEQGMNTFNGIYKRTRKAFTRELQKLFRLNVNFLSDGETKFFDAKGSSASIFGADYAADGVNLIRPAANPFYMSATQRLTQAQNIFQAARSGPGWDLYEVDMNLLRAWKVEEPEKYRIDQALLVEGMKTGDMSKVPPGAQPMPNPQMIIAQSKQAIAQAAGMKAQIEGKAKLGELQLKAAKLQYEIGLLTAQAANQMSQAKGVDTGHQIAMLEMQIAAKKGHLDGMLDVMKLMHEVMQTQVGIDNEAADRTHELSMAQLETARGNSVSGTGVAGPQDDTNGTSS